MSEFTSDDITAVESNVGPTTVRPDSSPAPITVDIWSDFACSWCYLGKHRLEAAIEAFESLGGGRSVEIRYHSYELSPELAITARKPAPQHFAERFGDEERATALFERMHRLGALAGIDYQMHKTIVANTVLAHELAQFADTLGLRAELSEALFRAYFSEGKALNDIDALVEIAESVGLDPDAARDSLESGRYRDDVRNDERQASELGVQGVPFYVVDSQYGISGAQEAETFEEALETVWAEHGQPVRS